MSGGIIAGVEFDVTTGVGRSALQPSVASFADGRSVVVWVEPYVDQSGKSQQGVYAQIIDARGRAIGSKIVVVETTPTGYTYADYPAVTILANGDFAIAWEGDAFSIPVPGALAGTSPAIYTRAFSSGGVPRTAVKLVESGSYSKPSIAALPDGGYVITSAENNVAGVTGLAHHVVSSSGTVMSTAHVTYDSDPFLNTATAVLSNGVTVSAGVRKDSNSNGTVIYYLEMALIKEGSITKGDSVRISNFPDSPDNISVTALKGATGGFAVVAPMVVDGQHYMSVRVYNNQGVLLKDHFFDRWDAATGIQRYNQYNPSITAQRDGGMTVAWINNLDGRQFINVKYIGPDGTLGLAVIVGSMEGGSSPSDLSISTLGDGRNLVTWLEYNPQTGHQKLRAEIVDARQGPVDLAGTGGSDHYVGTVWDDLFHTSISPVPFSGADTFEGGAGIDLVDYSLGSFSGAVIRLDGSTPPPSGETHDNDLLIGIENAIGTGFADTIHGSAVSNTIEGGAGNDIIWGNGGADNLNGGDGDDTLVGGAPAAVENDTIDGGAGNDIVYAEGGDDLIYGDRNDDKLFGQDGSDTIYGGQGIDELHGWVGNDFLDGEDDRDLLLGYTGSDTLWGGGGDDTLDGGPNEQTFHEGVPQALDEGDFLHGGTGNDILTGGLGKDTLVGGSENDTLDGGNDGDELYGEDGDDDLSGGAGNDWMVGHDGQDTIDGGGDDDGLAGYQGVDSLKGGAGHDVIWGGANVDDATIESNDGGIVDAGDWIDGEDGNDLIFGQAGNDTLFGGRDQDSLYGGSGDDALDGGEGPDLLNGGTGNDYYFFRDTNDLIEESAGATGGERDVAEILIGGKYRLADGIGIEILKAGSFDSNGDGEDDGVWLIGNDAVQSILGGRGDDTLDGGLAGNGVGYGPRTLDGGVGDDLYYIRNAADIVVEESGIDTAVFSTSMFSGDQAARNAARDALIASLKEKGIEKFIVDGWMSGTDGPDVMDGRGEPTTMEGGAGNDIYYIRTKQDRIVETTDPSGGYDKAYVFVDEFALNDTVGVEELWVGEGVDFGVKLTGNSLDNLIVGGVGNDTLISGGGKDALIGGSGDDTYVIEGDDVIIEEAAGAAGGTNDTVIVSSHYSLKDNPLANIEILMAVANGAAINLTGDDRNNMLIGNAGANVLDGGDGNDTLDGGVGGSGDILKGGSGDDIYIIRHRDDVIEEDAVNAALDTVPGADYAEVFTNYYKLASNAQVEVLAAGDIGKGVYLVGNDYSLTIRGNAHDDTLDGGEGGTVAHTLAGGYGNDVYIFRNASDVISGEVEAGEDYNPSLRGTDDEAYIFSSLFAGDTEEAKVAAAQAFAEELKTKYGIEHVHIDETPPEPPPIDVGGGNDAPINIAFSDQFVREHLQTDFIIGNVSAEDPNGDSLTYTLIDDANGSVYLDGLSLKVKDHTKIDFEQVETRTLKFSIRVDDKKGGVVDKEIEIGIENIVRERVTGTSNNDIIRGGAGKDTLNGGAGDDVLVGGAEADRLTGGVDNDIFVFDTRLTTTNVDIITDFGDGADKIHLAKSVFTAFSAMESGTPLSTNAFVSLANAHGADYRIVYDQATGKLFYDSDGEGSAAARHFATLSNLYANLSNQSFFIV